MVYSLLLHAWLGCLITIGLLNLFVFQEFTQNVSEHVLVVYNDMLNLISGKNIVAPSVGEFRYYTVCTELSFAVN